MVTNDSAMSRKGEFRVTITLAALPCPHGPFIMKLITPLLALTLTFPLIAKDPVPKPPEAKPVEIITAEAKASVVTIIHGGRGDVKDGTGTGFAIANNLIATCLHVIGEARPIRVRTAEGKELTVLAIHAFDRKQDLAILRIKGHALKPLPLGNSDQLVQGASVIALGNPMGLTGSVVQGVLSARRKFELGEMLQIAIPVEPGNSGGPILDRQGRVHGIMTMKSLVTANLGFAMPINAIKPLITSPNPVPMQRWLTIGALNPKEWKPIMGAQWLQRAGRITVKKAGTGFGGRSLCLSKKKDPEFPYELEVSLKLDNEAGAAGLVFSSDGDQKHYGFYPTAGKLRLTRFDGANVFTWTILKDVDSEHYKPGDWNTIKVRHEKGQIHCFVNDHFVFKIKDEGLNKGHVGLAKFRNTEAEFRNFRLAKKLPSLAPQADLLAKLKKAIVNLEPKDEFDSETVNNLKNQADLNQNLIRKRAEQLETEANQLRRLADIVHEKSVQDQLIKLMDHPKNKTDLLHAALLISRLDNAELEIAHYKRTVDGMAEDIRSTLPAKASNDDKLNALRKYLFEENGYHGSRGDYHNRSNSYINEVIDDREGIPITLAVLYMELARQLGLKMAGIGLPGHFVVAQLQGKKEPQLIDVYEGAKLLTRKDAAEIVRNIAGIPLQDAHLEPVDNRAIIVRMLRNLIGVSNNNEPPEVLLRYLNTLIMLQPDSPQERLNRALMHMRLKKNKKAKEDVRWLLDNNPAGFNRERLLELFQRL